MAEVEAAMTLTPDIDVGFVLLSGYLVFFMHTGFMMLSVGAVRSKNAKNIILKILLDACFGAIAFYLLGFAFAYGGTFGDADTIGDNAKGNKFIGWSGFALTSVPADQWYMWFFQFAFAATSATIVSGAVAERTKFEAYCIYAFFLTAWVYPVVAHWTWSAHGWASPGRSSDRLFGVGLIDFAGCAAVHSVGGLSGLAGAWAVGPRHGRFDAENKPQPMPGHNASFALLGVFILWFGWYGFNPGSALALIGKSTIASIAAVNTTLAAASGTLATLLLLMLIEYRSSGHILWDLLGTGNGTLAGLVAITAGCSVVEPWAAVIIGATAGAVYIFGVYVVADVLKVDDPLEAVAVHFFCGTWGLLMAAAFADKDMLGDVYGEEVAGTSDGGFITGGNGRLLAAAIVTILAIFAWTLGHMVPFFLLMKYLGLLRVPQEEELMGLDVSHHGGSAYGGAEFQDGEKGVHKIGFQNIPNKDGSNHRAREGGSVHNNMAAKLSLLEEKNEALSKAVQSLTNRMDGKSDRM